MYFKDVNELGDIFKTNSGFENFSRLKHMYRVGTKEFYNLLSLNYEIICFKKQERYNIIDSIDIIISKWENFYTKSIEQEKNKKDKDSYGNIISELFTHLSKVPEKERYNLSCILKDTINF
jgi:hypothetical protein